MGRAYIDTGYYTEEVFPSLGVRFIALMDNIDSDGNADLLPFLSIMNDYHLRDLSRKVKSVMKAKAQNGEYIGAWVPYGFVKDPDCRNRLIIDNYAASIVRRIYDLRGRGFGFATIAAFLNNEGILSPGTYRDKLNGKEKPARVWIACVVGDILVNESYIGNAVRFKTGYLSYRNRVVVSKPEDEWIRCENAFPRIISNEAWDAVRKLDRKQSQTVTQTPSLFKGLLRCADCGAPLTHKKTTHKSRLTGETKIGHSYICQKNANSGGSVCSRHTIRESVVLEIIREDVKQRLDSVVLDEGLIVREILKKSKTSALNEAKKKCCGLAERAGELAAVGKKMYEDRIKGIISVGTFKSLYEKNEEERRSVQAEYEQLSELVASEERRALNAGSIIPMLKSFLALENPDSETLSALIKCIIVSESEGRSIYRTHKIKIVYRFEAS